MNEIESYAVFCAEFPDDSKELNNEIVTPAGRNILEVICQHIGLAGITVTPPSQYKFYGWVAEFQIGKVTIWLLLQQPGPWLLIVEARASWLTREEVKVDAFHQGFTIVKNALTADSRIKELRWMTKEHFEASQRRKGKG